MGEKHLNRFSMKPSKILLIPILTWTAVLAIELAWELHHEIQEPVETAHSIASATVQRDMHYREWVSSQGGVYVPITKDTQPNPYLAHFDERDIQTPSGKALTLVTPSYMNRQVNMSTFRESGNVERVISLDSTQGEDAPDSWEGAVLEQFANGVGEFGEISNIDGKPFYRYMRPLLIDASCLTRHDHQGYKVGDISGGLSVSIPMEPLYRHYTDEFIRSSFGYLILWILGVIGVFVSFNHMGDKAASLRKLQVELDKKARINTVFHEIATSSLNLSDIIEFCMKIHESIHQFMPLTSFAVGLVDTRKECIDFVYSVDQNEFIELEPMPLLSENSLSVRVVKNAETVFMSGEDLQRLVEQDQARLTGELPDAWLGIPLKDKLNCHGLLMMQFYDHDVKISKEDLRFLEDIASRLHLVFDGWSKTRRVLESERRFRAINETAKDAICMIDRDGRITVINPAGLKMFGYTEEEMIGSRVHDLIMPDHYRDTQTAAFSAFQNSGKGNAIGKTVELMAKNKANVKIPVELSLSSVKMDDGWHAIAIIRDISQRTKTLEEMQRLTAMVKQGKDGIIIADDHNIVQYVNPAFSKITGYGASDIIGKKWSEVEHIDDFNVYKKDISNQLNLLQHWKKRRKAKRKDGTLYNEETVISPVLDETINSLKYIVITRRDITKEMNLEEQLQQSQKLESIGQLAAGIAHEINTPTQYVSDNIQFLSDSHGQLMDLISAYSKTDIPASDQKKLNEFRAQIDFDFLRDEIPAAIEQSISGIERVSKIVKAIKEFSHPGEKKMKLVDINHAIETTITITRNEWKYVADVTTDFQKDLPMVTCLPGEINQVVLNLIINAAHAIADTLKTRGREKGTIHIQTLSQDDFVQICVRDDGSGIPDDVQPRVFDPFFTTKPVGSGTGQGLSLAHMTVVNNHGGALYFQTEIDKGTTFFVQLPIDGKSEAATHE